MFRPNFMKIATHTPLIWGLPLFYSRTRTHIHTHSFSISFSFIPLIEISNETSSGVRENTINRRPFSQWNHTQIEHDNDTKWDSDDLKRETQKQIYSRYLFKISNWIRFRWSNWNHVKLIPFPFFFECFCNVHQFVDTACDEIKKPKCYERERERKRKSGRKKIPTMNENDTKKLQWAKRHSFRLYTTKFENNVCFAIEHFIRNELMERHW